MSAFTRSHRRLTALRLSALGIARPAGGDPAAVVHAFLAMQAQEYAGALWSVGLRIPRGTIAQVEAAHEAGAFVRSWPMRGTLHFVTPDDLCWLLAVTDERMLRSAAGRHRALELSAADFDRAETIAHELLSGHRTAARAQLLAAFETGGVSVAGQRGAHVLGRLAQRAVIVLTGRSRWALLDDVLPHPRRRDRDEAVAELAARYFTGHGPATIRDLAWWAGITLSDARAGLAAVRSGLERLDLDGESYFHRQGLEPAGPAVHLLPGFDEYLLGYADRSAPLAGEHTDTIVPGGNGMFLSTIVVNGEVVGSWRRTASAKGVRVEPQPFRALPASASAAVARAAKRYAAYLGTPLID